jgi:hypothetical protein
MSAPSAGTLYLERPAFWTEVGDPEAWLRALDAIAIAAEHTSQTGTPRTVAERCLVGVLAWRGAIGLFGVSYRDGRALLPGVGLVASDPEGQWSVTDEARALLRAWRSEPARGLKQLATHLLRESPWLRLLLLRISRGDWEIVDWSHARASRLGLKAGTSLVLRECADPAEWFSGFERSVAGRWLARTRCESLEYSPDTLTRKKGKDDLSLSPLTAPLHLLESVGWLSAHGEVSLPNDVLVDLLGHTSPAQMLEDLTARRADVRGYVAAEPVLRELLAAFGVTPSDDTFARWMDEVVNNAIAKGALELLAAEPGQARHGRGLYADPSRKLVRWIIHSEFDNAFQNAWAALDTTFDAQCPDTRARGEELTR